MTTDAQLEEAKQTVFNKLPTLSRDAQLEVHRFLQHKLTLMKMEACWEALDDNAFLAALKLLYSHPDAAAEVINEIVPETPQLVT